MESRSRKRDSARHTAEDGFQLLHEVVDVLELAVDGGEADERHVIDVPQGVHHPFADVP